MKKLLILIALALSMSLMAGNSGASSDSDKGNIVNRLCHALPDSIYSFLKNRPMIFYSYGHYGYSWSLIAKMDSDYKAFSGRVDYLGRCHFNERSESNAFDSTLLFSQNRALLSWGFDSIQTEAGRMKKIKNETYVTFYKDISVIGSEGKTVFSSDDATAYSGPDSVSFNKKFQKLSLIMYWLSNAEIREYIPDSAIYQEGY